MTGSPDTLVTRPVRFTGAHLFVNASATGDLRVEGQPLLRVELAAQREPRVALVHQRLVVH